MIFSKAIPIIQKTIKNATYMIRNVKEMDAELAALRAEKSILENENIFFKNSNQGLLDTIYDLHAKDVACPPPFVFNYDPEIIQKYMESNDQLIEGNLALRKELRKASAKHARDSTDQGEKPIGLKQLFAEAGIQ